MLLFLCFVFLYSSKGPVLEDWDIISPKDVIGSDQLQGEKRSLTSAALPFTQSLLSQVTHDVLDLVSQLFYQPVSTAFSQAHSLLHLNCNSWQFAPNNERH